MKLCANLRWKGRYHTNWSTPEELAAAVASCNDPFRCNKTCQPWGPDFDAATPGGCDESRDCYEPSGPELPTPPVS
jgi:hypothetical protein